MGFIFFGIVLVILGGAMVIKTDWFYNFLGPLPFAEKYLNTEGGSVLAYKAIGLIAVFVGFLMIFNLFEIFLKWVLPNSFFGG